MASDRSISRSLRRLAPAVLIVAAAVARGPLRRGAGQPPALLIFTNESLDQANVYAAAPGLGTRRIGTVMAGRTDMLAVPAELANRANLNIVARLPGRSAGQASARREASFLLAGSAYSLSAERCHLRKHLGPVARSRDEKHRERRTSRVRDREAVRSTS
jgi:hypothetical protein